MSSIRAPIYRFGIIEPGVNGDDDSLSIIGLIEGFTEEESYDSQVLQVIREITPYAEDFILGRAREQDLRVTGRWAIAQVIEPPLLERRQLSNGLIADIITMSQQAGYFVRGGR